MQKSKTIANLQNVPTPSGPAGIRSTALAIQHRPFGGRSTSQKLQSLTDCAITTALLVRQLDSADSHAPGWRGRTRRWRPWRQAIATTSFSSMIPSLSGSSSWTPEQKLAFSSHWTGHAYKTTRTFAAGSQRYIYQDIRYPKIASSHHFQHLSVELHNR